jgi:hypothetical protein
MVALLLRVYLSRQSDHTILHFVFHSPANHHAGAVDLPAIRNAIAVVRHLLRLFRLELQDPTRAANFVDSPNGSSRSVMFLITSPKNECTLASQLLEFERLINEEGGAGYQYQPIYSQVFLFPQRQDQLARKERSSTHDAKRGAEFRHL